MIRELIKIKTKSIVCLSLGDLKLFKTKNANLSVQVQNMETITLLSFRLQYSLERRELRDFVLTEI